MHDIILPLINMNIKIHDASLNGSFITYSISKPQLYEKIKSISQMTWMEYWFAHKINLSKMKLVWFHRKKKTIPNLTTAGWRLATAWAPEPYAQRYASERSRNRWSATKASRRGTWRVMIWAIAWIHEMLIGYRSPIHGDLRMDKLDLDSQLILYIMELGGCLKLLKIAENYTTLKCHGEYDDWPVDWGIVSTCICTMNKSIGEESGRIMIGLVPCTMIRLHRLFNATSSMNQ